MQEQAAPPGFKEGFFDAGVQKTRKKQPEVSKDSISFNNVLIY